MIAGENGRIFVHKQKRKVDIISVPLTSYEIEQLAKCQVQSVRPSERVMTWGSSTWNYYDVTVQEMPLQDFCKERYRTIESSLGKSFEMQRTILALSWRSIFGQM